jgi:membrane-bound inhibitor of C-type lysozyme
VPKPAPVVFNLEHIMRNSKLVLSFLVAAVSASPILSGQAATASEWRQVQYRCGADSTLTVDYKESGSSIRVAEADKKAVKLNARPAKSGFRYGDSRHELRGAGEAVTWKVGARTAIECISDDPAAISLATAANR